MTLGKDVSALFPDVLKNIATADLDQKKLVYLMYVMISGYVVEADKAFQELRQIASRLVYSCCEYICAGLGGPQSVNTSAGYTHDGLHSCRQNDGLYGGAVTEDTSRRIPVRAQDRGSLCG
jgi:hypothetical protein